MGEVLASYYDTRNKPKFYHDAVHDMESFLWVVIYICTTRQGPGGVRREELQPNYDGTNNPAYLSLAKTLRKLFEEERKAIFIHKVKLLESADSIATAVIPFFHPYFAELIPMVQEWWKLLHLAYTYRAYEYEDIHLRVLAIINKTIQLVEKTSRSPDLAILQASENEIRRRQLDYTRVITEFVESPV